MQKWARLFDGELGSSDMQVIFRLLLALPILCSDAALAMSCGNQFISEGQSAYQVEQICGQPQWSDRRVIYVTQVAGYENLPMPKGTAGTSPIYVQVPVNVDEWVYNFGPNLLMQKLTFENDRLVSVTALGYGN
jgi:hypothetical protein